MPRKLVSVNPTLGLVNPRCKPEGEKKIFPLEDFERAQLALPLRERLIFRLAICEGMRPGEITGLQRRDYYDRTLHIQRRVYRGIIDEPKSRRSRREIPATDTTIALLDRWLEFIPDRPDGWLFPSETGKTPIGYSNVFHDRIKPALAAAGISTNYQILRRTWANAFKNGEKDANVRAQLAGHSLDVHSNVYQQPQPGVLKRAMKKLDKRLQ